MQYTIRQMIAKQSILLVFQKEKKKKFTSHF